MQAGKSNKVNGGVLQMNVLESILGDDASDGGDDDIDLAEKGIEVNVLNVSQPTNYVPADSCYKSNSQMVSAQKTSDAADTVDEVEDGGQVSTEDYAAPNDREVNDSDDSQLFVEATDDTGNLEAEHRYFAFNVHTSDCFATIDPESNESSIKVEPEMKVKICNALKLSDATLFIASPKLKCFIGYALVIKSKISNECLGDDVQGSSSQDSSLPIRWGKTCCLPFKDTFSIMNTFNSEKPVSQFQDGQVSEFEMS